MLESRFSKLSDEQLKEVAGGNFSSILADMSDEELASIAGSPSTPIEEPKPKPSGYLNQFAKGARNTAVGLASALDIPTAAIGAPIKALTGQDYYLPSEAVAKGIDWATDDYTKPSTEGERVAASITEAIASMPTLSGAGKTIVKNAPKALKHIGRFMQSGNVATPTNVAANAVTSGVIQKRMEQTNNPTEAFLLGAGAGTLVHGGAKFARPKPFATTIGEITGIKPEMVDKFNQAGLGDLKTVADVTNNKWTKIAQTGTSKLPFAPENLSNIYKARPAKIASELGIENPMSKQEFGEYGKQVINETQNKYNTHANKLREDIVKHIDSPKGNLVSISEPLRFLQNKRKALKTPERIAKFDASPSGHFLKELQSMGMQNHDPYTPASRSLVPFGDLDDVRREVGALAKNHFDIAASADKGNLKKLYGTISEGLGKHFDGLGKGAGESWREYNSYWSKYKDKIVPHINSMSTAGSKSDIGIFDSLYSNIKRGGEKANILLENIPKKEKKDKVVSTIFHELGQTRQNEFSPIEFAKNFKSLDPHVQDVLLSHYGKTREPKVRALIESIDMMKATLAEANHSGTASHSLLYNTIATGATAAGGVLTGSAAGLSAVSSLGTLGAAWIGASGLNKYIFGNPKFIDAASFGLKIKNKAQLPLWFNKLEHVGVPKSKIEALRSAYTKLKKEDIAQNKSGLNKSISRSSMNMFNREKGEE